MHIEKDDKSENIDMKKKKSFYAQLTGIFRIVIFFSLLCSFLVFVWGSLAINKQLKENTKIELMLFAKDCDYVFDSVFSSALNISNYIEGNYKEALKESKGLDNSRNLVEFIDSQCMVFGSRAAIFVYDMNGRVYTKYGAFDEDTIYHAYYDTGTNDRDKWKSEIEALRDTNIGKISTSTIWDFSNSKMQTIQYQKYYEIGKKPFVVAYEIPLSSFFKGKYGNGNYGVMLPDSEIYFNKEPIPRISDAIVEDKENEIVPFFHDKSLYMMSHCYSNSNTIRYIYLQSYKTYFDYAIRYGGVFFGIMLFFFILAGGFSIWSSRRAVEPINTVMKEISLDYSGGQNELMNILNYLKKNKQEVDGYKLLLEEYSKKMQSVGIEHILMNFIYSSEKGDIADKYKLIFPFEAYYVVIFKLNTTSYENIDAEIEGLLQEMCGEWGVFYVVQIRDIMAGVINCNNELCSVFDDKVEILRGNMKQMHENVLEIAVSDKTDSISKISEKYNDCLEEINAEGKYKVSNQDILSSYVIGKDCMDILTMCIKCGQKDCALLFFEAIVSSQICYAIEQEEVKQMLYAVLTHVLVCHNDTVTELLHNFDRCHKPTEMIEYVKLVIEKVSTEYLQRDINKKILLQINVIQYINENLGDLKMSVGDIADRFKMSSSYLSKQFKALFGIALLEYIQKARVNEAARMLLYSDLSVNEISNVLGFVNTNVFIRIFKKFIGTTPGAFRNIQADDES